MRHALLLAGFGLWFAALSGCGGGDSESSPAVAGNAPPAAAPGMPPGPPAAAMPPGSDAAGPGPQGSGSSPAPAGSSSGSMPPGYPGAPAPEGSAAGPTGMPPGYPAAPMPEGSSAGPTGMPPGYPAAPMPGGSAAGPTGMPPGYPAAPMPGDSSAAAPGMPPGYPGMPAGGSDSSAPAGMPAGYPGATVPGMMPPAGGDPAAGGVGPENPYGGAYPGAGTMQGQQPPKPLTFADKAELMFRQGRERDGLKYLFAHALTGDDAAAKEVLDKMGWIGPLKKPALAVRWGIAVEYEFKGPRGYTGNLYPIGTTQNLATKGAGGAGTGGQLQPGGVGEGGFAPGGMGGAGQGNTSLQQYTGELGQKVLQELQQRIGKGDFGQVLASAGKTAAPGAAGGMPGAGMPGAGDMMPGAPAPGGFGAPGMLGGQPQAGRPTDVTSLSTGVVMLGVVNPRDLREKAQAAGVDAVVVFNVVVTPNQRLGHILNETTILLHDTEQAKELWESKKLNNIKIQIERADPKGDQDPVDREIEALFKKIDAEWHLGPLPAALKAEHVLNRRERLIGETYDNPLSVLGEIRMYHTRGLLPDEHLLTAYQKLIGEAEGTQLAKGSEEEKKKAIEQWLPSES